MAGKDPRDLFYKEKIQRIKVAHNKGHRAPHKPLLLLLALGKYLQGERTVAFSDIEARLSQMLAEFGPYRKTYYPNLPFIKLQNDNNGGLWSIQGDVEIDTLTRGGYSKNFLLDNHFTGKFSPDFESYLLDDSDNMIEMARFIVENNFEESLHSDILEIAGIDLSIPAMLTPIVNKRKRDPHFREDVLIAYNYKCAVCGFELRLGRTPVGLEAAHIKWHSQGGKDQIDNGLALCSIHHKLFDLGAYTLNDDYEIILSNILNGNTETLERYEHREIKLPTRTQHPLATNIRWHQTQVFKGSL